MTALRTPAPVAFFPQPCTALCADRTCRLYADRLGQYRTFECGVFKDAQAGRITFARALRLVKRARRKADTVRRLLGKLGDTEENRSLSDRFQRTQRCLESEISVGPPAPQTYLYDANGNMTGGGGRTISWTPFNQVKRVQNSGNTIFSEFSFGAGHEGPHLSLICGD